MLGCCFLEELVIDMASEMMGLLLGDGREQTRQAFCV
jgi:hypothetical protein